MADSEINRRTKHWAETMQVGDVQFTDNPLEMSILSRLLRARGFQVKVTKTSLRRPVNPNNPSSPQHLVHGHDVAIVEGPVTSEGPHAED